MCSEASAILHGEGDQGMRAAVNIRDWLGRSLIRVELPVLRLLCRVSRDRGHFPENGAAVQCGHHRIYHEVPTLGEEVQVQYCTLRYRIVL